VKKAFLIVGVLVIAVLLASCVPVEPNEMLPYCKDRYEILLIDDPNFPPAFIGACVANLQSGKPTAFISLCGYEPFWEMIEEGQEVTIDSRKACQEYFKSLEE
jgi:hypothetical protein